MQREQKQRAARVHSLHVPTQRTRIDELISVAHSFASLDLSSNLFSSSSSPAGDEFRRSSSSSSASSRRSFLQSLSFYFLSCFLFLFCPSVIECFFRRAAPADLSTATATDDAFSPFSATTTANDEGPATTTELCVSNVRRINGFVARLLFLFFSCFFFRCRRRWCHLAPSALLSVSSP